MSRIFNHKKQYACTEVFRLEELQEAVAELEDLVDEDEERFPTASRRLFTLSGKVKAAIENINEFIKNLEEQDRPLEFLKVNQIVDKSSYVEGVKTLKSLIQEKLK